MSRMADLGMVANLKGHDRRELSKIITVGHLLLRADVP